MNAPSRFQMLPRTAVYALRASTCLAQLEPGEWAPSRRLAETSRVPKAYLSKVMRRLVQAGLVEGRKGWHGGFRLVRPAHEVTIQEVLAALDESIEADHCIFDNPRCNPSNPCPLHHVWEEAKRALRYWAETHTLADAGPCDWLDEPADDAD